MITYRNATEEDMAEIAKVHIATQPEYFTSTLGEDLLKKFYTEFLKEDRLFVLASDPDKNGKIVGFCMGNYYGSQAEKRWENKYREQIVRRLLFKCLQFNSLAISRCCRRVKGVIKNFLGLNAVTTNKETYDWHLLSLGVLSDYRGHHIGSNLIDEFEKCCLLHPPVVFRGGNCTIGAYKWNKAGCSLYEYKGYRVFEETKEKLKYTKDLQ